MCIQVIFSSYPEHLLQSAMIKAEGTQREDYKLNFVVSFPKRAQPKKVKKSILYCQSKRDSKRTNGV